MCIYLYCDRHYKNRFASALGEHGLRGVKITWNPFLKYLYFWHGRSFGGFPGFRTEFGSFLNVVCAWMGSVEFMLKQRRITRSLRSNGNRRSFFMVKGGWSFKLTPPSCPSGYFCTSGSFIRVYDVIISRVTTFTFSSIAVYLVTVCVMRVVSCRVVSEFS